MPPRHLPFALILCRHSEFPPFLRLTTFVTRRIVITAHRRHSPPRLDMYIRIEGERSAVVCVEKSASGTSTHTAAILPRIGVAPWGRFCIFREGERGRGKNEHQRGGGCAMPQRGQAPVTPKRLLHSRFASATHYKTEIFVDGTRADAIDLPDMQIFKARFRWVPTGFRRPSKPRSEFSFPTPSRRPCILPDTNPEKEDFMRLYRLFAYENSG